MTGGRLRLALCAWAATLAAAGALLPLVGSAAWFLQAAALTGLQAVVGAAARRRLQIGPVAVAAQALVSLLLLTALFAREHTVLGLLPGPDAAGHLGALLSEGVVDAGRFAVPAPLTDGIRLLLVGSVAAIGLLVDVVAVTCRSAAPAGLPLLALYSVASGIARDGAPWPWFLCAAAGYLLLLLAGGREQMSRWGRVLTAAGGVRRPAGRGLAPARGGRRIGAVVLGVALAVPAALPPLSGGLLDPSRHGRAPGGAGVSAVDPLLALQDNLNLPENRTVLTYRTDARSTADMYLRIVALDRFDGTAWWPSQRRVTEVVRPLPPVPGLLPSVPAQKVATRVQVADWYAQGRLPMPYPAEEVRVPGRWRFEPGSRTLVGDRGQTTRGLHYEVDSLRVQPTARQLAEAPEPRPRLPAEYTHVPDSLPDVVEARAREVTGGAESRYEAAVQLQNWFSFEGGFRYDTRVEAGTGSGAIVRFLEEKEGFCVHFAFSMAAMSRTLGIPARVAVGFTPGTRIGTDRMAVGLQDAHAWPELYFEGVGWTRFEPTPTRGSTPYYALPELPGPAATDVPEPLPGGTAGQDSPSPAPDACAERAQRGGSGLCGEAAPRGEEPSGGAPGWTGGLVDAALWGLWALVLVAGLLLPLLWRSAVRACRLGGTGRPAGARVLTAWREAVDCAWDHGVAPEASATPRRTAERIVRLGRLEGEAAAAAHRLASAVERVLYAPEPGLAADPAADAQRVRAGLWEAAGPAERLRALLVPRSAARGLQAVPRWRSAAADAVHGAVVRRAGRVATALRCPWRRT